MYMESAIVKMFLRNESSTVFDSIEHAAIICSWKSIVNMLEPYGSKRYDLDIIPSSKPNLATKRRINL